MRVIVLGSIKYMIKGENLQILLLRLKKVLSCSENLGDLPVAHIQLAFFPTTEIPLPSRIAIITSESSLTYGTFFLYNSVFCIIPCGLPGPAFIILTSKTSSDIAAWQILVLNTNTCH